MHTAVFRAAEGLLSQKQMPKLKPREFSTCLLAFCHLCLLGAATRAAAAAGGGAAPLLACIPVAAIYTVLRYWHRLLHVTCLISRYCKSGQLILQQQCGGRQHPLAWGLPGFEGEGADDGRVDLQGSRGEKGWKGDGDERQDAVQLRLNCRMHAS